ncbi:hypothetical protein ACI2LF_08610 [Kribbella sp. NPDC020789]
MIIIKPIPADAMTRVRDTTGKPGWLHDCGAFVYSSDQPRRCGVCWSACLGSAFNGNWQPAYVTRQVTS